MAFVKPMPTRDAGPSVGRDSSLEWAPLSPEAASAVELWSRLQPPSPEEARPRTLVRPCRLGHFQVEEQIGRGGMGAVFRAVDTRLDRVVALKVLSPAQSHDHSSIERFRNEARAAARMDHENIARVYYVGEDQGLPFIAFEFVHGVNVRELIERQGTLSPADVVNYALQIASALRHTDAAGVVHRDIKPSNIIITPLGRAKLVDLGLARKRDPLAENDLTADGTTLGTFDYISPEQAKDPRNVDVRSDIYSLGCTMYHMLTGQPPYPVGTMLQKLLDHQGKDIPDAAATNPLVPARLAAVVRRMMASDPRDRYATPDALIDELSPIALELGLVPQPADGVVWRQPSAPDGWDVWKQYSGWIITAALLLLVVFYVDQSQKPPRQRESTPPGTSITSPGTFALGETDRAGELESAPLVRRPSTQSEPVSGFAEHAVGGPRGGASSGVEEADSIIRESGPIMTGKPRLFPPLPESDLPPLVTETFQPPESPPLDLRSENLDSEPRERPDIPLTGRTERPAEELRSDAPAPQIPIPSPNPFVLVVNSVPQGGYPTLDAACTAAPDNAVIELQFNGEREIPQPPVKIVGKHLIIRAARDYRPTLRFAVSGRQLPPGRQEVVRMISVTGGSLDLYNVDLRLSVDPNPAVGQWVLVSLTDADHLELHGVSATVENESLRPSAALIERAESARVPYSDAAPASMRIVATDCFLRGEADLILDRTIDPAEIRFDNVAVALDGAMIRVEGTDAYSVLTDMTKGHDVELELKHVTAVLSGGLAHFDVQSSHSVPRLAVSVGDSVLSAPSGPLITMQGELDVLEFRERLSWSDEATFLQCPEPVWRISGTGGRRDFDRAEFDGQWGSGGRPLFAGSVDRVLRPRGSRRFSLMTREDLLLDETLPNNPAIQGASDLTDAGVDWDEPKFPRFPAAAEPLSPSAPN